MKTIRYWFRILVWWLRCLWREYPKPTIDKRFSRSHMRKVWSPILRDLDRRFNDSRDRMLLRDRALMVARRRKGWFPEFDEGGV